MMGVSREECLAHAEVRDSNGVSIRLLADTEGEVCRKYGVLEEKESNGQRRRSVVRSTFVIDKKGMVRHAFYNVNPRGHASDVLDLVKSLR